MRLLLICHAAASRDPHGIERLSDAALGRSREVGRMLPPPRAAWTSPAPWARQTAEALGLDAIVDDDLADWKAGLVGAESERDFVARVGRWLTGREGGRGTLAAVTHATVVRACVTKALGVPAAGAPLIDIAPCSVTELSFRAPRWHLAHVNWEPALLHIPRRRAPRRAKSA